MIVTLDLDGTLMPAQEDFDAARYAFVDWLHDRSDGRIPVEEAVRTQARYSAELWDAYGASPERFPIACRTAYEELSREYGMDVEADGAAVAYEHGRLAYLPETGYAGKGFYQGVEAMFDVLDEAADAVYVVTVGDPAVQERKIRGLGLDERVDDWYVVDEKEGTLTELVENTDDPVWHVGNSETSDLFPALAAGAGAIHIPGEGWAPDEAADDPATDQPWLRLRDRDAFDEAMDAVMAYEDGDADALHAFRSDR